MTLPRIWTLGVPSMPLSASGTPMLASADAAALDSALQQATDKGACASTVYGQWTLAPGASVTLDSPDSLFVVTANSSTGPNGSLQCGHGDFPLSQSGITRTKNVAMAEMMSNVNGTVSNPAFWPVSSSVALNWLWYLDPSGSAYGGTYDTMVANSAAILPLTRMHDGATVQAVSATFLVSSSRTTLPVRYPAINMFQYDPFLNVVTSLTGWTFFATPGSISLYKNSGAPNTLTASLSPTVVSDDSQFLYFVALLDEDYNGESAPDAPNEWLGASVQVHVTDLHFQ